VFRCEPDGSKLEVVHVGLRIRRSSPSTTRATSHLRHNCDSATGRWVHIVPGGDSGWRCGYQYGTYHTPASTGQRGPWNREHLAPRDDKPAHRPPTWLAATGPLRQRPQRHHHYPGVGLMTNTRITFSPPISPPRRQQRHLELALKPRGELRSRGPEKFVTNMPTDCEFGPDGAFYWSDWTGGWNPR